MNNEQMAELARLAEAARDADPLSWERIEYKRACSPAAILALIADRAALVERVAGLEGRERKVLNAAMAFAKEHIEGDALHESEISTDAEVHASDERYNETKRLLCDAYLELVAAHPPSPAAQKDVAEKAGCLSESLKALAFRCPEINMSNYGQDEVDALQAWAFEIIDAIADVPATANKSFAADAGSLSDAIAICDDQISFFQSHNRHELASAVDQVRNRLHHAQIARPAAMAAKDGPQ